MSEMICHKTKHRDADELNSLMNRLKRIEGQVRGVQNMLSNNAYCTDILTQVAAISAALNSFSTQLLDTHIKTCVVNDIRNGDDEVVSDLINTIHRLMK